MKELSEKTGLSTRVLEEIREISQSCNAKRVVLFGSRARGDYHKKSDIDLAVYDCERFAEFCDKIKETVWTLLEFDIIEMSGRESDELIKEISRDGVVLYEKV